MPAVSPELLAFLPTLTAHDLDGTAPAFVDACYAAGWVLRDFDWTTWKRTPEALSLRTPDAIAHADPDTLAKLLTTLVRQERFCEGTLSAAHDAGLLTAILRRMASL